uniref:PurM-like C-terminal domain-containing protein n=1 Tax=Chlamydomonas euryale TaxID=1486919 RepID=A0A7R9Z0Z2_9CHLO
MKGSPSVRGRHLSAALSNMRQSSAEAARVLRECGATACTDVTGFGLLGHLVEMVRASNMPNNQPNSRPNNQPNNQSDMSGQSNHQPNQSKQSSRRDAAAGATRGGAGLGGGVHVRVSMAMVPLLDGAADAVAAGVVSSLHPSNALALAHVVNAVALQRDARWPLLVDPQTGGGLLAAVPASAVEEAVRKLRDAGYAAAAAVGEVVSAEAAEAEALGSEELPAEERATAPCVTIVMDSDRSE